MMEATVRYLDGVRFETSARGHKLICDQPVESGGADQGMTPPELMLASLGTCAMYYAVQYLRTRGISPENVEVRVEADKAAQPPRLGKFRIIVTAPGLDARHEEFVRRAVEKCLIHNTLLHTPEIETIVQVPVLQ